ncbi:MAG: TadE family protein [Lachnospiraceae bacterium]|nr:TadE family protein [Lachnospiraceae bacterium]
MDKKNKEAGSMIIEATIVFPVMFLVIFLMLFAGNAYMQKCRVEAVFNELALDGAACCADPLLFSVDQNSIPAVKDFNADPYGFVNLDVSTKDFGKYIDEQIKSRINNMSTGLFSGMQPVVKGVEFYCDNPYVIYPTFTMNIVCEVVIPVRLLGQDDFTIFKISNHIELPASDTMDLIRTIDMAEDYLVKYGVDDKIKEVAEKVKGFFKKK